AAGRVQSARESQSKSNSGSRSRSQSTRRAVSSAARSALRCAAGSSNSDQRSITSTVCSSRPGNAARLRAEPPVSRSFRTRTGSTVGGTGASASGCRPGGWPPIHQNCTTRAAASGASRGCRAHAAATARSHSPPPSPYARNNNGRSRRGSLERPDASPILTHRLDLAQELLRVLRVPRVILLLLEPAAQLVVERAVALFARARLQPRAHLRAVPAQQEPVPRRLTRRDGIRVRAQLDVQRPRTPGVVDVALARAPDAAEREREREELPRLARLDRRSEEHTSELPSRENLV